MIPADAVPPPSVGPLTWTVLGRFFAVPLLIIGAVVGGAVVVVLLFGGPAAPEQRTLDDLLQVLEANSGERSAGVLLPREKELWQTALELSERLEKKEAELTAEQVRRAASRLAAMVRVELEHLDRITAFGADLSTQRELRSNRFDFLLRALARTECEEAIEPLVEVVEGGREPYVAVAIRQLGDLHALPASKASIGPMLKVLTTSTRAETLLTACAAISVLAPRGDASVTDALSTVYLAHDGEIAWGAALALARLGCSAGRSTLLDLLDRTFLESGDRYQVTDETGQVKRYPLPPERVNAILTAAMEAVAGLENPDLWGAVDRLQSDRSPAVRGRAIELRARRGGGQE